MSYTDLHLHLLPGVDDGPPDLEASLEHARRLVRARVLEAVVTPHVGHPSFPLEIDSIAARTEALQASLDLARIPLRLHPGGEIHPAAATRLSAAELDPVAQGPAGARWVLLEVPFAGIDAAFLDGCRAIRDHGFSLVIAHPERAHGFLDGGAELLQPEIVAGTVLQVNVCSLAGDHGPDACDAARWLVRHHLAYVLASDGHGRSRPETLAAGFALAVSAGVTADHAWRLTQANPAFLLRHGVARDNPLAPLPARPWADPHRRAMDVTRRERQRLAG